MSMLKTGSNGWHQRFNKFGFLQLAKESKGGASDEFIRML